MVQGTCPNLATGTISVTRGSRTLGGIQVVAGPKPSSPTAPLVFYWHGTGGQSSEFGTQARAVRDGVVQEGGILVSFQGTTGGDLLSGTSIFGAGDFELADQIVACAVMDYNVDPRRIFATGCSAGGLFSGAMGVMRSNYMAAIAPNSGGLLAPGTWQNANSPALMTIHGAAGRDVVVVDFSTTSKTADDAYKGHGGFVVNCNHMGGALRWRRACPEHLDVLQGSPVRRRQAVVELACGLRELVHDLLRTSPSALGAAKKQRRLRLQFEAGVFVCALRWSASLRE